MLTLVIEISREGDKLKMGAFERTKGIDVTLKHYSECAILSKEIENLSEEITNLFSKAVRNKESGDNFAKELKKNGRALFDLLLTIEVKKAIKNTKANFLLISIDEHLVQIPWELLYDGEEFLCIRFAMGRSVRTKQKAYENKFRDVSVPIKMLIVADPTGDLNSAYEEGIAIRNELDKRKNKVKALSKTGEVYTDFIKRNIRDYDIVHFAGHSDYNSKNPSDSGWVLKDGKLTARDIVTLGATAPMPSIVFSNACQSGTTQEWIVSREFEDEIYGLANAFLLSGVRHYIGTFWRVLDKTCLDFANEFYKNVTDGLAVGEAVRLARIKLVNKYGYSSIIWSSYMLYGDPSINLFFVPSARKISKEALFQKQIAILLIILGSIVGTGILGFILYRNYFLRPELQEKMAWAPKNILAVMPFENLNNDKNIDWMGSGVADIIAMKLGRLEKINVIDRIQIENVWKEIKKTDYIDRESALKIANILGADRIIMGTFQKMGNDLRISARLINVKDGVLIGTADATNKYNNLFTLEDAIALNITEKLNIKITDAERVELKKFVPTNNISAFEFIAKATNAFIAKDIQGAIEFCKKAIEIDPGYIQANLAMGYLYEWAGELEKAKIYYIKAVELSETRRDRNLLLASNFNLGKTLVRIGKIKEGIDFQNKALKIAKSLNDQQNYAVILYNLGLSYLGDNEYEKAKSALSKSMEAHENLKNSFGLAASYAGLGLYYSLSKEVDLEKARQNFEEAVRIYESLNFKDGLATVYSMLGGYYYTKGQLDEGILYFNKALKISLETGNKFLEGTVYDGLGRLYAAKGEFGNAKEFYEKFLIITENTGNKIGYKNTLYSLAFLYMQQLSYDKALEYLNIINEKSKEDNDLRNQFYALRWIGSVYYNMGLYEESVEKYKEILKLKDKFGFDNYRPIDLMEVYAGLGECSGQIGDKEQGEKYFQQALREAINSKDEGAEGYIYMRLGNFYSRVNDLSKSIDAYKKSVGALEKINFITRNNSALIAAYVGLAENYRREQNKPEALLYYKRALPIAEKINSPLLNSIKSNLFFADKENEEKKEEIKNKEAEALYKQASALYFNKDYDKALEVLKEASKKEPASDKIISLLCLSYENLGRFDDAIKTHLDYIKSLDKNEEIIKIIDQYSLVGDEYFHTGRLDKSKEYYDHALLLAKESGNKESLGQVYADYSMVWEALGQDDKAIEFATKGIELCKDTSKVYSLANAYQVLSNIYSKQNNKEKALEYAQQSLKIDEESGSIRLGRSYALVGNSYKDIDIVKSLEYFNKAVDFFDKHNDSQALGNVYHEIGSIYEKTQQIDKALEYFNKSLEISEKRNDKWTTLANYLGLEGAYYKNKNYKLSDEFRNKYITVSKELGKEEELGLMYAAFGHRYEDTDKNEAEKYLLLSSSILEKYRSNKSLKSLFFNYSSLGHMYYEKKDFDKAMDYYQKAIDITEKESIIDKDIVGLDYKFLGDCARIKGNFAKTLEAYMKARSIFIESGIKDKEKLISGLDNEIKGLEFYLSVKDKAKEYDDFVAKAINYHKEHKWELALEYYKKALVVAKELTGTTKDKEIYNNMFERGKWLEGEVAKIESYLKEVETGKKTKMAKPLEANAILYVRQNKLEAALESLEKALKIYEDADDKEEIGLAKMRIGLVYLTKNDIKKAEELFQEMRKISENIEDKEFKGLARGVYGILFEKKGEYKKAEEEYNAAINLLKETEYTKTYIIAYNNCLGSTNYKKQDYKKSLEYYQKALEVGKEIDDPSSICLTEVMMAYINFANNSLKDAGDSADNALAIAERLDDKEIASIASLIKGKTFMQQNSYEKANEFLNKAVNYAESTDNNRLKTVVYLNLALLAKLQNDNIGYEKWLNLGKEKDNFKCATDNKIAKDKVEQLFKEIIEEKDFFKRIWL